MLTARGSKASKVSATGSLMMSSPGAAVAEWLAPKVTDTGVSTPP